MREALRHYARTIHSVGSLRAGIELLGSAAHELGFETAACLLWPASSGADQELPPQLLLGGSTRGAGIVRWNASYMERGKYKLDFGYRLCRTSALPVLWSTECRPGIILSVGRPVSPQQVNLAIEVRRLTGVRGGIVVPIHVANGAFGYIGFPSSQPLPSLLRQWEECEDHLLGMAHRFIDAMTGWICAGTAQPRSLSRNELGCLDLLAAGRTLDDVARALGVSTSTVRFHLYSAENKLGAHSRTQAIAKAATLGLLGRAH